MVVADDVSLKMVGLALGDFTQHDRFDPKTETFPGDKEASALLSKECGKPWEV